MEGNCLSLLFPTARLGNPAQAPRRLAPLGQCHNRGIRHCDGIFQDPTGPDRVLVLTKYRNSTWELVLLATIKFMPHRRTASVPLLPCPEPRRPTYYTGGHRRPCPAAGQEIQGHTPRPQDLESQGTRRRTASAAATVGHHPPSHGVLLARGGRRNWGPWLDMQGMGQWHHPQVSWVRYAALIDASATHARSVETWGRRVGYFSDVWRPRRGVSPAGSC